MNTIPDQEIYWDKVANKKEFTTPFQIERFKEYVTMDGTVLDVGCGYGRTLHALYHSGFKKLYGVDFSGKMIERGKGLYPHLSLSKNENGNLPFDDGSIDAVILLAVLTCIIDDQTQESLISEIKRVLTPNGVLYINDFMINTDERNKTRYEKFEPKYNTYGIFELPEGAALRHHSESRIQELTKDFGQQVFEKVVYTTMNGNQSNGFYYIGEMIDK